MISNNAAAGNSPLVEEQFPDYDDGVKAFLRASILLVAALSLAAEPEKSYPPTLSGGAPCGSCIAPEKLSWKTVITPEKEPGEPLVITGKVFQPDGKTSAEGMVLWVITPT